MITVAQLLMHNRDDIIVSGKLLLIKSKLPLIKVKFGVHASSTECSVIACPSKSPKEAFNQHQFLDAAVVSVPILHAEMHSGISVIVS